ncbi:iron compound ABC transporter ATP-binding protein [Listeria floridensis FSL S10-1187]|uniref:Iron compound ABC transporter ATP-binding protein n=1 Tax=Listeria floridensis FSL S10-1187 TaxID=1265817 RepID=A0ABP3AZA8_9LIST|nr:iron compound ABC transporter ATP-binding protein [Listeria floridensis FSL S10-1187]
MLLLDEPTTYLDISHQLELLDLLKDLNQNYGLTIVLVLHDLNQAALYSDRIIACEAGHIVKTGSPKEVLTEQFLKEIFKIHAAVTDFEGTVSIRPISSARFPEKED